MPSIKLNDAVTAGRQLAVARLALNQLASTLQLMLGEESEDAKDVVLSCKAIEHVCESLVERIKAERTEADETVINALFYDPPQYIKLIDPANNGQTRFWLSQNYQRAAITTYLLLTANPDNPDCYDIGTIAVNSQEAEIFLNSGLVNITQPFQHVPELMIHLKNMTKNIG